MSNPTIQRLEQLLECGEGKEKKIVETKISKLTQTEWRKNLLRIDLTIKNDQKYTQEQFSIIAKLAPQNVNAPSNAFKKEVYFYTTMVPALQDFQKNQGSDGILDCFPEFLGVQIKSEDVNQEEMLFMGNLSLEGYKNADRHVGVDLPTTKVVLRTLAEFHGVPLAIRLLEPESFEKKIKLYIAEDINRNSQTEENDLLLDVLKQSMECLPYISRIEKAIKHVRYEKNNAFSTISHGNVWIRNIMLKYIRGNPVRNKFLDFQWYVYDTPVKDLIFFFVTSVELQVLKENLDDLLQFYHENLLQTLKNLNCDISQQLSFKSFAEEIALSTVFEMVHAIFVYLTQVTVENPDNSHDDLKHCAQQIPFRVKEKVWWVVEEFGKRKWLNV